jgi:hypothetical protein
LTTKTVGKKKIKKERMEINVDGNWGLEQDQEKAVELWLRAGELGCAESYHYVLGMFIAADRV